jgi:FkbM family methyltransferase
MNKSEFKANLRTLLGRNPDYLPNKCFSQDGEDLILDRLMCGKQSGFYVDVGAHHPVRFSNTYLFYLRGWRGINIDAQPGSMQPFQKLRKRDINLEIGVDAINGYMTYFQFNEPALNTFNEQEARLKDKAPYRIIDQIQLKVLRLDEILERHLPMGVAIDFISVDVEGKDLAVLQSNNWNQYRPRFVLAETLRTELLALADCPVVRFMLDVGYRPVSKAYNTTFFEMVSA